MISVIGSINLDLVARVNQLPQPGETVPGHDFERLPGGKGANQALAVLRAGGDLAFCGAVGDDAFAQIALSELSKDGADLSKVAHVQSPTGIAMILVSDTGENMIAVVPGANGELAETMTNTALAQIDQNDHLLMQQEIPAATIAAALRTARDKGATSILNIAPFIEDTPALVDLADIIIANETEFADLSGTRMGSRQVLNDAVTDWARTNRKIMIVTLGAHGVIAATQDGAFCSAKGLTITPVDTVGAGDTFCGYLAVALQQGLPLEAALRRAAIAGSLACLKPGAQPAIPRVHEVETALES